MRAARYTDTRAAARYREYVTRRPPRAAARGLRRTVESLSKGSLLDTPDIIEAMRGWIATVAIVPAAYAQYAPLVIDGLMHFLGRLPPARLETIVAEQVLLPPDAGADERFIVLVRQCPTLHKLGQVIARQSGLPAELRTRLQGLEMLTAQPGNYDIADVIARELGAVPGLTVSPDALAEGSVEMMVSGWMRLSYRMPRTM